MVGVGECDRSLQSYNQSLYAIAIRKQLNFQTLIQRRAIFCTIDRECPS
ncbi:hypothetical protein H6S82_06505 [Planktothrix sp. FACHB-1355]|uniref:Uncharacterized protein n=1 Tax=Aerosakkonema funiforme FACHB-1375 TaxID=2949571 RepID=A0A926VI48_9CYAN|nr:MULTISPECIES: hypothetical protein [Oscillatoriales]MBD2184140.1 hypothetical protein [Aerosakkonema funiforme FACHB-1375]MBD3558506.1 hypothetical protein [Planktothrix sp. FACHB-1355]